MLDLSLSFSDADSWSYHDNHPRHKVLQHQEILSSDYLICYKAILYSESAREQL